RFSYRVVVACYGRKRQLLERWFPSRLAPAGASAEAAALAMAAVLAAIASIGNAAGSPSASSRDLKMLQQMITSPLVERIIVGALLRIATGAGRRLGEG
ncbi:hypothetical protein, partial [Halomonas alkalisoli]|uniref:hypothetical protein n=1 Tax=Halomonas alkalisoli TaxID=2907158 RepID=UPI001F1B470C